MDQFTIEDVPIWRLRLAIEVGDVDDAGTDDDVWVRFQSRAERFHLDYGRDDFTRGSRHVYDISNLPKVLGHPRTACTQAGSSSCGFKVSDIEELTIGLEGDDGIYLKRVDLLVNNDSTPIFTYTFAAGHWLDNDAGNRPTVQFSSTELRGDSHWTLDNNAQLLEVPQTLPRAAIQSMIEGYTGDFISQQPLFWANVAGNPDRFGGHVVSQRVSAHRLAFTLYLQVDASGVNPSVDVFFGITRGIEEYIQGIADDMIGSFGGISAHANVPFCTKGTFNSNGDLEVF